MKKPRIPLVPKTALVLGFLMVPLGHGYAQQPKTNIHENQKLDAAVDSIKKYCDPIGKDGKIYVEDDTLIHSWRNGQGNSFEERMPLHNLAEAVEDERWFWTPPIRELYLFCLKCVERREDAQTVSMKSEMMLYCSSGLPKP